jgi:hypothetical protein
MKKTLNSFCYCYFSWKMHNDYMNNETMKNVKDLYWNGLPFWFLTDTKRLLEWLEEEKGKRSQKNFVNIIFLGR